MKIFKKYLVIGIIFLFVGASIIPSTIGVILDSNNVKSGNLINNLNEDILTSNQGPKTVGNTIYVDDDFNESTPGWGVDHFNTIQDGIDATSTGEMVFVYNGTYSETVTIKKSLELVGESNLDTIIRRSQSMNGIRILNTDNVIVHNFHFEADGSASYSYAHVYGEFASNCEFYDLNIGLDEAKGYGFELNFCDNLTVYDCYVNAYFASFRIVATEYSSFSILEVHSQNGNGFDMFGGTYNPTGESRGSLWNTFENIIVEITGDRGFQGAWIYNTTITNMTIIGGNSVGIMAQNAHDTVIQECTAGGNTWVISFNNAERGKIINCTSTNSGSSSGIGSWYGSNVVISGCVAENNDNIGLLIQESTGSSISDCMAINNSYEGIDITWCKNTIVTNCTIYNTPGSPLSISTLSVKPPTVSKIEIPLGRDNEFTPITTPEVLLKQADDKLQMENNGLAAPEKYDTAEIEQAKGLEQELPERSDKDYDNKDYDYSMDYVDNRGLSIEKGIPVSKPRKAGLEDEIGVALWECESCSILNSEITNISLGIDLIDSPYSTLRNNVLINSQFYVIGEYDHDIDDSNTIDGKPLKWLDGASDQVLDNPNVGFLAVVSSENITVKNFDMSNNGWGLLYYNTIDSKVQNCNFSDNICGLGLISCASVIVENVELYNNEYNLDIMGGSPGLHDIDTSNIVNGKPIRYLHSLSQQTVDGSTMDIGYLGLFSCDNITVQNVSIDHNGQGVLIVDSTDIIFLDCILEDNKIGIFIDNADATPGPRGSNVITDNIYGIYLDSDSEIESFNVSSNQNNIYAADDNNIISDCIVSDGYIGICLGNEASYNDITGCEATYNSYGIYFYGDNNTASNLHTSYNSPSGIYLDEASDNTVTNWDSYYDYRGSWGISYRTTISDAIVEYSYACFIWHYESKDHILHNITASHLRNEYAAGAIMLSASEGFTVTDCEVFDSISGIDISFVPGNDHTIDNCFVHDTVRRGIGLEVGISWGEGDELGLFAANDNLISNCTLVGNNSIGFLQERFARATTVNNCNISNNHMGMWLQFVQDNVVMNTIISNNEYNFGMPGYQLEHFTTNDILDTTLINGKPAEIRIGESDIVLDNPDVGWLGIVSCDNVTVQNFDMEHNGQGILFAGTTNSVITDCEFAQNRLSIELWGSSNCQITNCTANDGAGGILIYDSSDITISECEASNNADGGDPGIFILNSDYSTVTDCDCSGNIHPDPGLLLYNFLVSGCSYNTITNVQILNAEIGCRFEDTTDNIVSYVTVIDASGYGLYCDGLEYSVISNCSIIRLGQYYGIYLYYSYYNEIIDCHVNDSTGPAYYAIALTYSSSNNLVEDCLVENASRYYGIAIFYDANDNIIRECDSCNAPVGQGYYVREAKGNVFEGCNASYNAQWGFRVRMASGNKIVNCNAYNNTVGIYAHSGSYNNEFYYNNLVGNSQSDAYDEDANFWDDGEHGNYYSTYIGFDNDSNGIGDSPHSIPGGDNQDNYPKIMPYPNQPPVADFTWEPSIPVVSEVVNFDSSASYDPDDSILSWYWTFGDGSYSTDENPTHIYTSSGLYTVTLMVTDSWNPPASSTNAYQISVMNNTPPIADAGPDQIVNNRTVSFNGSGSYDPDGYITLWIWDFGDGTNGTGETAQHTYSEDGFFIVQLTVIDNAQSVDSDAALVIVDTVKPTTFVFLSGDMGENEWYVSPVEVTLIAIDDFSGGIIITDKLSGIYQTWYRIDGGDWVEYIAPFMVTADGYHSVDYYSIDDAGNVEDIKSVTLKIDQTAPILDLIVEKIGFKKWLITANVSDETSGISKVEFYIDNVLVFNDTDDPYEYNYSGNSGVVTKVIVYDNAGHTSTDESPVCYSSPQQYNTKITGLYQQKLSKLGQEPKKRIY